jgi:O-antigen/teichoic acid export membrane protein
MTNATAQRVARNTAWFTVGSIGQKLLSLLYFTVVAMAVGVEGTGRYFFALTFTALFVMGADWGMSPVIIREVAKDRSRGLALFRAAAWCKVVAIVLTVTALIATAAAVGYPAETQRAVAVAAAALAIDALHLICYAVLRGLQRVHYEAVGIIVNQAAVTVLGIGVLVVFAGLQWGADTWLIATRTIDTAWLLVPFIVASAINLVIALYGLAREGVFRELRTTVRGSWRWLLAAATPFALTGILARIYTYSDTFLLSRLSTNVEVGYYSVPFKIAFAFQFIPLALIGALYPAMSETAARDRTRLGTTFTEGVRSLLLVAMPIAFGIGVLAGPIVATVYGSSFLPSVLPLAVLAAAIPLTFVNFPAGYLLNAVDRQATSTILVAIATTVNILLNIVLIPTRGAVGAAISALAATALLTIMNLIVVRHVVPFDLHALVHPFLRILVACLAMSAIVLLTVSLPLVVPVLFGAITYGVVAYMIGAVRRSDLAILSGIIRRRASQRDSTP